MNKELMQKNFDKVVAHARKQKCKSLSDNQGDCVYRGSNGTACFIGCLFPDEIYDPKMEGKGVESLSLYFQKAAKFFGICEENIEFYRALQNIHDNRNVSDWEEEFVSLANDYDLNWPVEVPA